MEYGKLIYKRRGDTAPQQYTLRLGSTTIGRDEGNDLVLDADGISRYHTRIICTPAACTVTDLESTNGTFLNQVRLAPNTPQPLRNGDTLRIGAYALRYVRAASTPAEAPAATPVAAEAAPPNMQPGVVPPEVAGRLTSRVQASRRNVVRLPGNSGPPRIPPVAPRVKDDSSYLHYLPPIYHEHDFVRRFLLIFQSILDPLARTIDQTQMYFDPRITTESFLPWLASWMDLVLNENWPVERRRALISAGADLYRWRGTRYGLSEFIRIYTGVAPRIVEPGQEKANEKRLPAHVFQVILEVPDPSAIDRALVMAIIESEKPAHTSYMLDIRRAQ